MLLWKKQDQSVRGLQRIPATSSPDAWPIELLVWLGRAGISAVSADAYGVGWAESIERAVLPCQIDGEYTGAFTCRYLGSSKARPKYLGGGTGPRVWACGTGPSVVVEDILSAIRVYEAGYRGVAVLGTSFEQETLDAAGVHGDVVSWLDPDKAGAAAHRKLRQALALRDCTLYRVRSERDPKLHSKEEIQHYIQGALDAHD